MIKVKLGVLNLGLIFLVWFMASASQIDGSHERPLPVAAIQSLPTAERPTLMPNRTPTPSRIFTPASTRPPEPVKAIKSVKPITTIMCPTSSTNQYSSGIAYQFDRDDPVRPARHHADKNLALRGYELATIAAIVDELVYYGRDDPTQPPQLATLFWPYRLADFSNYYCVHHWRWQDSPDLGRRANSIMIPPVTALGLQTNPGETLRVPVSGYDIGGEMAVLVIFADKDTVALRYTREDSSGSPGYTVHVDNICPDPNLLFLYKRLDAPDGPRYRFAPDEKRPYSYDLPTLAEGQPFGLARSGEVVVAIVDSGTFMDPRSCDEWWQIRPDGNNCPTDENQE